MFMTDQHAFAPTLEYILGFLLNKAAETSNRQMELVTGPHGLNIKQYGLLVLLQAEGPQAQITLSQKVGLDRTSVMNTIDRLEERGLVERQPNPTDRRKHSVMLTSGGLELLNQTRGELKQAVNTFLNPLSGDEQALLRTLLLRLTQTE